ncbi:MAG: hypothetical protein QOE90_2340 [Thermoplasmata archaeon]|jgi:plastocyanin|nr:hypothetical protein [Thermoplasmata archaeon]
MKTALLCLAALLALPLATTAAPPTCADPCSINATSEGYVLPVATITSGSTVVFTSSDIGHATADNAVLGDSPCFLLPESPGSPSPVLTLTISGGHLVASYTDLDGRAHNATCNNAVALPDGGFALPYLCKIHTTMRGLLVVEP